MRGRPEKLVHGQAHGAAVSRPTPRSCSKASSRPTSARPEGPFGEWTGHYNGASQLPVVDIVAIYHRNDPILLGVPPMGGGSDEMARYRAVMRSAMIKQNMTNAGVPGVEKVWCHEVGGSRMLHGIAIKQSLSRPRDPGGLRRRPVRRLGLRVEVRRRGRRGHRRDRTSSNSIWAMCTRSDPKQSIQFIEGAWDSRADPRLEPEKRAIRDVTHSVAVIDACRPYKWRDKFPRATPPHAEMAKKAKEMFGYLMEKG